MNAPISRKPLLALGLDGSHLVELTGAPHAAAELDGLGLAFAVAGFERIAGRDGQDAQTLDPSVAATVLAQRADTPLLIAAAPHRDHPYNLARRLASAAHLSAGRTGLLLGARDAYAPSGEEAWGGAGLTPGVPLGPGTTRDAALAIRKLWHSWPYDSIVADRDTGIFAHADRAVHIDHHGVFDVAGPLNVPSTPHGSPVLAWFAEGAGQVAPARGAADVVVLGTAEREAVESAVAALAASLSPDDDGGVATTLLFVEIVVGPGDDGATTRRRIEAVAGTAGVAGVLLRVGGAAGELRRVLTEVLPHLADVGTVEPSGAGGPLRRRLGLPEPADLLAGARSAFPAPVPQAAL
ncbi:hypothetical protein GCM10023081_18740 [Arthrobacter ginkgonis]|uniref:Uncharacterized protein n=1 Tax=Arthrobacter ginkgonis TaxID=1630594 RepID=A0ABP7C934_9MICC